MSDSARAIRYSLMEALMKLRIAIFGGDDRAENMFRWGKDFDFTFYQAHKYGGQGDVKRLLNALGAGKFDAVVFVTKLSGHGEYAVLKAAASCRFITWDRGFGELAKQIPDLVRGRQAA